MIERYELLEELGRSPHAVTTLRVDRESGTRCVVKSLDMGDVDDLKIAEMFRREAKVLRGLDHPGIPRLLDAFEERADSRLVLHLVQEYVDGENLAVARERRGGFDEEEVVRIARDLMAILRYLHSFSPPIIHRDIKPGNVILASDGSVRLIDFSGVRDTMKQERHPEGGFTIVGSYGYMPFEQYEGRAFPASDIYALGMTLIFLLTGREPADLDRKGMRVVVPDDATLSNRMRSALERMIEPDVERRLQSVDDVERALPEDARSDDKPRFPIYAGLAAVLFVGVAGIALLWDSPDMPSPLIESPRSATRSGAQGDGVTTPSAPRKEEAWASFEPMPPDPKSSRLVAQGLLTHAGQPLARVFSAAPRLRIWSERAGGNVTAPMRYSGSAVELFDLEPGVYSVWAQHWDGEALYSGGSEVRVAPGRVAQFEFHLTRRMEIRGLERAERTDRACEVVTSSPVVVSWKPLEQGTWYDYTVYENRCDGKSRARPLTSGSTRETSLTLELSPNESGLRYQVNIGARRQGAWVGSGGTLFVVE